MLAKNRCFVIFFLFFLGNDAYSYNDNTVNYTSKFEHIQTLKNKGELDKAISIGKLYLAKYPKDADVLLLMGLIYYQKKDFIQSEIYLKQALKLSPNYLDVKLALINLYIAQRNFMQADRVVSSLQDQELKDKRVIVTLSRLKVARVKIEYEEVKISYLPVIHMPKSKSQYVYLLKKMQKLRLSGNIQEALAIGESHLQKYPMDVDVLLIMGLIYYQEKNFALAKDYLNKALEITPNYLDVKLALIRVAIAEKKFILAESLLKSLKIDYPKDKGVLKVQRFLSKAIYQNQIDKLHEYYGKKKFFKAKRLALQILAQNPDDEEVRLQLANIYLILKDYQQARREILFILGKNTYDKNARLALIKVELAAGNDRYAMSILDKSLELFPNDADFLMKRAEIYAMQHKYAMAAHVDKQVLSLDIEKQSAWDQLNQIGKLNPHYLYGLNEAGVLSEYDNISDLKNNWEYSNFYYTRNNRYGSLYLGLNNADRFGINGNQAYISLLPVINKDFYVQLATAYAHQPVLFPTYYFNAEGFFAGLPVELSAGYSFSYIIPDISYSLYTLSVSKEIGDYWISFRPNFYRPLFGKTSLLYTLSLVRYHGSKDVYSRVTLGSGTSPNLADLLTVNFLVIKNNFISYFIQFPIWEHKLLLTVGGDYQHWLFTESGQIREISGGILGLNYRFEG